MVTIDVAIYPDRAASIRAGLDPSATSVAVDLDAITQDERDLLADHTATPVAVTTPTVEALLDALRAAAAEERKKLNTILEAYRTTLRERRVKTWTSQTKDGGITYEVVQPDWPSGRAFAGGAWSSVVGKHHLKLREITESDEAAAWTAELEATNKQVRDAAWVEQRNLDRQQAEDRERGIARLREWAIQNGSERVRLLIEEDMNAWLAIAEDEFFAAHTPASYLPLADDQVEDSWPAPTAAEIRALRAARETSESDTALSNARLARLTTNPADQPKSSHIAFGLDITSPTGAVRSAWQAVPAPETEPDHEPG